MLDAIIQLLAPHGALTAEQAAALATASGLGARLALLNSSTRSRLRDRVTTEFGREVAEALLPLYARGRPRTYDGHWTMLSKPTRDAIALALEVPSIDELTCADWTPERVSAAADAAVARFPASAGSAAMALANLRKGLAALGVGPDVSKASARPGITQEHNEQLQRARDARVADGLAIPPPFEHIAELAARIDEYLAGAPITPQVAADLMVTLSARPGEAVTLEVGEQGGVRGMLKKRGNHREFALVSAVGADRARAFLEKWRAEPIEARRKAMAGLTRLTAAWQIQTRDLRAVGAALAVRAAALEGRVANEAQARDVHRAALRHEEPAAAPAQDHYTRVQGADGIRLRAAFEELSPAGQQAVAELIAKIAAQGIQ